MLAFGEDPVAALRARLEQDRQSLRFDKAYGYLPAILDALHIPVESQMAVFSKTSIQSLRIEPSNPRVLFFNDSVTVGWVRGGFIELAAQNPGGGIHFYALRQRPDEPIRNREDCVNCHKSGTTQLRSATVAPDGAPANALDTDSRTPFDKLWGGWYVTGSSVPPVHKGNAVFDQQARREIKPVLDPKFSLANSSDVVALMVFAHQMRMWNLLAHPDNINELVDSLLFIDEPPLPGPIRGDSGFTENFSSAGPRDRAGRALRQLDLDRRLMRYPCSYTIYSETFDALPAETKAAIYQRMWTVLSGQDASTRYEKLSRADRRAVIEILRDTKKDLPAYFQVQ